MYNVVLVSHSNYGVLFCFFIVSNVGQIMLLVNTVFYVLHNSLTI